MKTAAIRRAGPRAVDSLPFELRDRPYFRTPEPRAVARYDEAMELMPRPASVRARPLATVNIRQRA